MPRGDQNCNSCGAKLTWIITENGKHSPMESKPSKGYIPYIDNDGNVKYKCINVLIPHWKNCPQADQWRKR